MMAAPDRVTSTTDPFVADTATASKATRAPACVSGVRTSVNATGIAANRLATAASTSATLRSSPT